MLTKSFNEQFQREEWSGYQCNYVLLPDESRCYFTIMINGIPNTVSEAARASPASASPEIAWRTFNNNLKLWLEDKPGFILWRHPPVLYTEHDKFCIYCKIGVAEDYRFTQLASDGCTYVGPSQVSAA